MINFLLLPCWLNWIITLGVFGGLITAFFLMFPVVIWLRTVTSKCPISLWALYAMKLRKSKVNLIVEAYINCVKSDLDLSIDEIEAHYVAGGNVLNLSDGLIMAKNSKIILPINTARAIDLSGRNLVDAVKDSISPKIIESDLVKACSKDGFEIKAKARITVLAKIGSLIGGASENTIIAKVNEALMNEIGESFQYADFMQNPQKATNNIFEKNLDENTAFKIISINISEMSLGKNVEAQTMLEEAEIDKQISQAKAEERKAMAMALEQEAKARTQEAKIRLIEAQAKVPQAIAIAFENGNIGINDYYKLENMLADTQMRQKFGVNDKKDK